MKFVSIRLTFSLFITMALLVISMSVYKSYAQSTYSELDSTPIAAIIMITNDNQGNTIFDPQQTTVRQGEEILFVNNLTTVQTFSNGVGPEDPMAGKRFSSEIQPNSFAEYLATNLSPGNYSFYLNNSPNITGELIILP